MNKRAKRVALMMGAVVALLLLLLFVGLLLIPNFLDSEKIKDKMFAEISRKAGGKIDFQTVEFSVIPPRVMLRKGNLSIPGTVSGTVDSLAVYPRILPLLVGRVKISKVQIQSPDLRVNVLERSEEEKVAEEDSVWTDIRQKVRTVISGLESQTPGLTVVVVDGNLNLLDQDGASFRFGEIQAGIGFPPEKLRVDLICRSNLWDRLSLDAWLSADDLNGRGQLIIDQLEPELLTEHLLAGTDFPLGESQASFNIEFETKGLQTLAAEVRGSAPRVSWGRTEPLVLKCEELDFRFSLDKRVTTFSLAELLLEYPRGLFSGELQIDRDISVVSLEIEGREVDIASAGAVAGVLAPDVGAVQTVFKILKEGEVPAVAFRSKGQAVEDLDDTENLVITGKIFNGIVVVPGLQIETTDVHGEAIVSQGILEAEHIKAKYKTQRIYGGALRVGLEGEDAPLHLDASVETGLSSLPALLQQVVKEPSMAEAVSRAYDVKGSAKGRLVIGETMEAVRVRVDVSEIDLSASYEGIPYTMAVTEGRLIYDWDRIEMRGTAGRLGSSTFSGLSGDIVFEKEPLIEILSGNASMMLSEIYPMISSYEAVKQLLPSFTSLQGNLRLTSIQFKGPVSQPEQWDLQASGQLADVVVGSRLLPAPLTIAGAKFQQTPESVLFTDGLLSISDASFQLEGQLEGHMKGLGGVDLELEGVVGPDAAKRTWEMLRLPPKLQVGGPLSVSKGRLSWNEKEGLSFAGNLSVPDGPVVVLDMLSDSGRLVLDRLDVQDVHSRASVKLDVGETEFHAAFQGHLTRATVDRLLVNNQILLGSIEGDFEAHILLDRPMDSTASGALHGRDLEHPLTLGAPFNIEDISLLGNQEELIVDSALIRWGDQHLNLSGDVAFKGEELRLDLNLSADGLEWRKVKEILFEGGEEKDSGADGYHDTVPVEGILRVRSAFFTYDRFTWAPFEADILFGGDDHLTIAVKNAKLCGIATPGAFKINPQDVSLDFKASATKQDLEHTSGCLSNREGLVTGRFDMQGKVDGQGSRDELFRSLRGSWEVHAEKGRVYKALPFSKVLAVLNVTEIFRGSLGELGKEGFGYHKADAKGSISGGILSIEKAHIDAVSMNIIGSGQVDLIQQQYDIILLAAPLKTMDSVVKRVPVLKDITGGTLVTVAVKIEGDLANPEVTTLPASRVGQGVVDIMKKTLQFPIKIVEPLLP